MFILVGLGIVFVSMLGGFMMAGGHPGVLLHASEFVIIFGMAGGVLVIATPMPVIKEIMAKLKGALSGKGDTKETYVDLFKLAYARGARDEPVRERDFLQVSVDHRQSPPAGVFRERHAPDHRRQDQARPARGPARRRAPRQA
jgi:flagellar motor component MotA